MDMFSGHDLRRAQFSGIQMSGLKVSIIPSAKPPRPAEVFAGGVINRKLTVQEGNDDY